MPGAPEPGRPERGGRSRRRVATLVVACALVVGGGAFAVTEAVTGPGPGAPAGTSTAAPLAANGLTGQAAVLNDVLASASSAVPPATRLRQAERRAAALLRLRRALARLHLLGGMYGQYTFETKKGPRTLAFERGTISKVAGDDVTVRANDGTTWTWVLTGASVVREDGARASASALAVGQRVFAGGKVTGSVRDARLIVVRAAAKAQ